ncbi:hypothetical protein OC834_005487 [Tilletia horrida]|uniref:Uncharacterized protein n=1 Tax=Tilletia horrida TaxID=155126 RepID=A0AAN6G834_9BASI|nr:hypothetical protein OC842_006327 [Tilletia horrida]KAK0524581.1 hypothetical protein OC834_005487 [Tilletia horrida]
MPAHAHLGWVNPVVGHDFPDPGVRYDPVSKAWYAFATNGNGKNVQCSYTYDFCTWHHHDQDVLPGPLPPWTSGRPGFIWAPEIIQAPQNRGGWLMYVTVQDGKTDKQAIGVAYTSAGPLGPYHFVSNGPIVSRGETGGSLDPQPFEDPVSGKRYLVYKNDEDKMYTSKKQIWIHELSADGLTLVGERVGLLGPTQPWQGQLLEAPYLTFHRPSNSYCLFYSSGTFTTEGYATSYAISRNGLFGPYEPSTHPLLFTDHVRGIKGPGGACVLEGVEGHHFIVFHSLSHEHGPRPTCIHRIEFAQDGTPSLPGRPNTGRRIRLLAEAEDDQAHGYGPPPTHIQPAAAPGAASNASANGHGPSSQFPGPLRPGGNIYAQGGGPPFRVPHAASEAAKREADGGEEKGFGAKISGALFKRGMFDKKKDK